MSDESVATFLPLASADQAADFRHLAFAKSRSGRSPWASDEGRVNAGHAANNSFAGPCAVRPAGAI